MKMRKALAGAACIVALMVAISCSSAPSATSSAPAETLKLGTILPMSGAAAAWGVPVDKALSMRAEDYNKAGGITVGGKKYNFEIVTYDSKGTADGGAAAANRLVSEDKLKFVLNLMMGGPTGAALPILEPAKVVTFHMAILDKLGPYTFKIYPAPRFYVPNVYKWMASNAKQLKKWTLMETNDDSGKSQVDLIQAAAKASGLDMTTEMVDPAANDFYPVLTRILAQKPDMIDTGRIPPGQFNQIVKQARELGFKGPLMNMGVDVPSLVKLVGNEAAEGIYVYGNADPGAEGTPEKMNKLDAAYQAKYKEKPFSAAYTGSDTIDFLVDGLKAANSLDPDAVAKAIEESKHDSSVGPVQFLGKKTYGINRQLLYSMPMTVIKNGIRSFLGTIESTE